jgi:hypothetical protein
MSWIPGCSLLEVSSWHSTLRAKAAEQLLSFFLASLLIAHEVHGDPHSGNFRFVSLGDQVRLGILDFGCAREISPVERNSILALLREDFSENPEALMAHFAALGFDTTLLAPIAGKLWDVTCALTAPFRSPGEFDPSGWNLSTSISEVLGEDRWNLRFAGPPALLLLVRALSGLIVQLKGLDASIDWHAQLAKILHSCGEPALSTPAKTHSNEQKGEPSYPAHRVLRIKLTEAGETKVRLTMGLQCVATLVDLVPDEVLPRLKKEGIEIEKIAQEAVIEGYPLGDLISWSKDAQTVRIWIDSN